MDNKLPAKKAGVIGMVGGIVATLAGFGIQLGSQLPDGEGALYMGSQRLAMLG